MHYLILGNCAAALNAVEGIRSVDEEGEITIISKEPYLAYARCLITNYLLGTHEEKDLWLRDEEFYENSGVNLVLGKSAVKVFPEEKKVEIEGGKRISYDRLLIATGSSPKKLGVEGEEKEGVFGFRTLDDAKKIRERTKKAEKVLVFGGGLIGLKAGYALKKKGLEVEVIVKSPCILSRVVNPEAGKLISRWLEENGIKIRTGLGPEKIIGNKEVEGVILDNGEKTKCELIIVGKGVSPNLSFLEGSGIKTHWGVVVDDHLATNFSGIYAAGDVAETKDLITGEPTINALWSAAQEQGWVAGINMAGEEKVYPGSLSANATEFFGLPFISMGRVREKENVEIKEKIDEERFLYKRLIFKEGRLIGTVMVGNVAKAGIYMALIRRKVNVEHIKDELLEDWVDAGLVRGIIEGEEGFRESISPEGKIIKFA